MNKQQPLYDVYVSYPPGVDHGRVDACIRDNLPDTEAEDLIAALEEHPQAIIAEQCTREERANAQHYFSYLGLYVIIRLSLELAPDGTEHEEILVEQVSQCPVCYAIIEDPEAKNAPVAAHISVRCPKAFFSANASNGKSGSLLKIVSNTKLHKNCNKKSRKKKNACVSKSGPSWKNSCARKAALPAICLIGCVEKKAFWGFH